MLERRTVGISAARIAIYHQVDATGADPQEDTFRKCM